MDVKRTNLKTRRGKKALASTRSRWLKAVVFSIAVVGLGVAAYAGWNYWQDRRITTAQNTVNSKYQNIQLESDTSQNNYFRAHATYVKTENQSINQDIKTIVDRNFLSCKQRAELNTTNPPFECHAGPTINFATNEYIEVTYTFRQFAGGDPLKDSKLRRVGLLYDRKKGNRLGIAGLFKPGTSFAESLSNLSRDALSKRFDSIYYSKGVAQDAMTQATQPQAARFNDFLLTTDEKLTIIFEPGSVAPAAEGIVEIELATNPLYDLFNQTTIDIFLPKLKEQREAAARLAEAAAEARQRAQELVGANRANIDCTKMKCIALTYDDGPYAPDGDRLLDILKQRNAVATFCMVGNRVATYAAELKQVVDQQNEICNHSWDHSDFTNLSDAQVTAQVQQTNQVIFNASGVYPKLMRPPYGAVNPQVIADINMPIAMWSVDTLDWRDRNADIVYQRAIAGAKPGAVILMHEIHPTTIDAAARIIDELQAQGYVLVTMSELFGITKDNLSTFNGKELFNL